MVSTAVIFTYAYVFYIYIYVWSYLVILFNNRLPTRSLFALIAHDKFKTLLDETVTEYFSLFNAHLAMTRCLMYFL